MLAADRSGPSALLAAFERAALALPPEELDALLADLARTQELLRLRRQRPAREEDALVDAAEAARRLGVDDPKALYREAWARRLRVEVSEGRVRFSSRAIEKFIRDRLGR